MDLNEKKLSNLASPQKLYLAFELSSTEWKLGFTVGLGQAPRLRAVQARDLPGLMREIELAKKRFGLGENTEVLSCYEAGRDGFWLHRYLEEKNIENLIVDSASIEVSRRFRRAKTDRLDVGRLLAMLVRYYQGEKKVWSIVRIPSITVEDQRQLHREMMAIKKERTRHINRIKAILFGQGVVVPLNRDFLDSLGAVRLWDGSKLSPNFYQRVLREYARYQLAQEQIKSLEHQRRDYIRNAEGKAAEQVRQLQKLKGIGENSAWLYVMEFFSWRNFQNRREVGALAGLTPTPHQSGSSSRERGISKAGNRFIRAVAVEIAWAWLRYQPKSKLTLWYQERFAHGGSRARRIGIVALARKLLVAFWRYLEYGVLPEGAVFN
jgi:transposase